MSKTEMFAMLLSGFKMTHDYFQNNEYLYMEDGVIKTEDGYEITPEFWNFRKSKVWDTNWKIYK
jgi:hypothetical protein